MMVAGGNVMAKRSGTIFLFLHFLFDIDNTLPTKLWDIVLNSTTIAYMSEKFALKY